MDDLIEIVRQYNVIYDSTCKHYKDHSTRIAVWEEIGQKLNQPSEKCKDDWDKLRNAYINALKRRRKKKSRQAGVILTPWKYEEQMSFLLPFIKSRQSTNHMSRPESPEYFEPSNYISKSPEDFEPSNYLQKSPEPESPQSFQSEHRPETPYSARLHITKGLVERNQTCRIYII
ncbi:unnamed protein product [Leptosia nina]|uniref:MADF domain-containing protein n=1 Tax=Leptosia nina TaxID=320188 RepID=A0AAV1JQT8_9NEOP